MIQHRSNKYNLVFNITVHYEPVVVHNIKEEVGFSPDAIFDLGLNFLNQVKLDLQFPTLSLQFVFKYRFAFITDVYYLFSIGFRGHSHNT